jgi:uncharacterized protein YeaO (DUF488 family)
MKAFAIKTAKGYFAYQGNQKWFQDEPKGWAQFCSESDAEIAAKNYLEIDYIIKEID